MVVLRILAKVTGITKVMAVDKDEAEQKARKLAKDGRVHIVGLTRYMDGEPQDVEWIYNYPEIYEI